MNADRRDHPDRSGRSELEDAVAAALRARAGTVPETPWHPRVHAATKPRRTGAVLVAAAALVLAMVVVVVVRAPAGPPPTSSTSDTAGHLAPGHVYYSLSVSGTGGNRVRSEVWQPQEWTGVWQRRSQVGAGAPVTGSGKCLSFNASASADPCTLAPGWTNPTPEFLAHAPRDPAVILAQLAAALPRPESTVEHPPDAYTELVILRGAARANGLPADLSRALQRTAALLAPASPSRNLDGVPGTAYTEADANGVDLVVVFDAEGTYVGSPAESFSRGSAAELGAPPVKLFP